MKRSNFSFSIFLILIIYQIVNQVNSTKLNYPRVLLPIFVNDLQIRFQLEVLEKGCFQWTSSRSDLIQITPLHNNEDDCSSKAIVTAITKSRTRNTAIVLAEDLETGEILRCDVILDLIDKLGVLTTTRELYLEEAPETFELILYDSQGNAFTTLEGIEFDWKIGLQHNTAATSSSWNQVLRFLDFSASKYHEIPKDIEKLEVQGLKGYKALLEGINTGYASVTVRLPHPEYSSVPPVEVDIVVLANLLIDPVDVNILVGDSINFRILQLKQGKIQEISNSNQYYLEIEDSKFAKMSGSTATGLEIGRTSVVLRDKNVLHYDKELDHLPNKPPIPRASLTVVNPAKIKLDLLPFHNWITIEGQTHDIAIDLYTSDNKKIRLGSKYKLKSSFDSVLFNEHKRNANGSRIRGEAAFEGTNPVTASFNDLATSADMLIYSRITLLPRLVVLPYNPNKPDRQKVQFTATGGDKNYVWFSSNTQLLQITQQGLAESKLDRVHESQEFENCSVKVALARNPKISETAKVLFMPPIKLEIVAYNFETAVGDYVNVFVALYAYYNSTFVPFTSCENLSFELDFSDQRIFTVERHESDESVRHSCRLIKLKGNHAGSTNLKVSYSFADRVLKDEVILNAFDPLTIFNPQSNEIVLPVGSSRIAMYQNGPQKIYNVAADLVKNVKNDKILTDIQEITTDYSNNRLVYNVLCKKIGESELKLEVYNILNRKNYIKYKSEFTTKIYCVKPRFINLFTNDKLKSSCPIETKNSLMLVNSGKDSLDIEIEVLDIDNKKLDNISSLVIDWQFTQANGILNHNIAYNQETEMDDIDGFAIPKRDFLKTSIPDNNVNHKIKATVKQYDLSILNKFSIIPESPQFGIQKTPGSSFETPLIENELNFLSFDSSLLPIRSVSIFLAPNVKEIIKTGHGSGYYDIKVIDPAILDVEFQKQTSELVLKPKSIGNTKVRITDRCLKTDSTVLDVSVVSIGRIELLSPDLVEKSRSREAIVRLYDSNNLLMEIDLNNLEIYELSEDIKNGRILQMKLDHQLNLGKGEIRYKITGTELGETKIIVSSGIGNRIISSPAATVQVFAPLMLIPRNATILVGSTLEVSSRGGPKPDVNIEYQVQNGDILGIDGSVVEGLKVGKTKVVGRCVGRSISSENQQVVFSEDVIYITVINLHGIKIKNPLSRMKTEAVMPVSVWGDPDISPLVLGTLRNLKVHWSTTASDIIEINGPFEELGVLYQQKDLISVRVRGLKPGKAKIMASVNLGDLKFSAQKEVVVFRTLELESPKKIVYDPIIVPPNTAIQLKANLDDVVYELSDQENANVINVSKDGFIRSGDTLGTSWVIGSSLDEKLSIPIEVKNIHYIMATVQPGGVSMRKTETELPQNLNFNLKVSLHDNLGNQFSHEFDELNALKHKLAKSNDIYVHLAENFSLSVDLLRESSNVLQISLKDAVGIKHAHDYLKLAVKKIDSVFQKSSQYVVGDVLCFDSPLSEALIWRSNNQNIVSIDEISGVAKALKPSNEQRVVISHGKPNGVYVDFEIEVKEADKVEFVKSFDNFNGEEYFGHFIVGNHLLSGKKSNLIANNQTLCNKLDHRMEIDFVVCKLTSKDSSNEFVVSEKFQTSPVFDRDEGYYACKITALTTIDDITNLSKNKNYHLDLEVRLRSGVSSRTVLKLIPAVKIIPKSIFVDEVAQQEIVVSGMENILQKVQVSSSDPDRLSLIPMPKTAHGQLQYRTKLLRSHDGNQDLFIRIESPMTHQNIVIPILAHSPDASCSYKSSSDFWSTFFDLAGSFGKIVSAIVLGGVIAIVLVKLYPKDRYDQNNSVFQTSKKSLDSNTSIGLSTPAQSPNFPISPINSQSTNPSLIYKTSPFGGNISSGSSLSSYSATAPDSPIYGDTTLHSPQKRVNRRNL